MGGRASEDGHRKSKRPYFEHRPRGIRKSGRNVATVSRHMMLGDVSGASGAPVFKDLKLAGMFFGTSSDGCVMLKINAVVEQLRIQLDNCSPTLERKWRTGSWRARSRSR